jgi:hypothetical protein
VGSIIAGHSFANATIEKISPGLDLPTAAILIAKGESKPLAKQLQGKPVVVIFGSSLLGMLIEN